MVHHATTTATVTSTMNDAALTISDQSGVSPGFLVNGTSRWRRACGCATPRVRPPRSPTSSANTVPLASWAAPVTSATVPLQFQQAIGATEALRERLVLQAVDVRAGDNAAVSHSRVAAADMAAAAPAR